MHWPARPLAAAAVVPVGLWRTMRRRPSRTLLLLLAATFACKLHALAATPLRLAVSRGPGLAVSRGPVSLLIYVAEAQKFFEAEAVPVQLRDCSSGKNCFAQLADGTADLATAAELVVSLDSSTGGDSAFHRLVNAARRGDAMATSSKAAGQLPLIDVSLLEQAMPGSVALVH